MTTRWIYAGRGAGPRRIPRATDVFSAVANELLATGDVEKALQRAFRLGYEAADGEHVDGLRDLLERLRAEAASHPDPSADSPDQAVARQADLATIQRQLKQISSLEDLAGLDTELIDRTLSDTDRAWLEQWQQMTIALQDAGLVVAVGDRLQLTPRAIHRIGAWMLTAWFVPARRQTIGDHEQNQRGQRGTATESSSPWEFGQPFDLHVPRTLMNAIRRAGAAAPLRLQPDDLELNDRESSGRMATVLMIDMSRSMFQNGCWIAAKRAAVALDTLIRSHYPRDILEIIGFSSAARLLTLTDLPSLTWDEYSHGTNLQAGLQLARQRLLHHHGLARHVILITDGEPNTFVENGEIIFENPVTERSQLATLREVGRLTRDRIAITTFLLSQTEGLRRFVRELVRVNRGRVIVADERDLGRSVVVDFARGQQSRLS